MRNSTFGGSDFKLWGLMHRTSYGMFRAREKELQQSGISSMHAAILFFIKSMKGKATPAEISHWIFRESHSVSEILSRMEERGLIKRVRDPERKNRIRIVMLERGEKVYEKSIKKNVINRLISSLSIEEQQQLTLLLQKLQKKAFQELGIEDKSPLS